ncbi:HD domain-containing phosphohydrolase [Deinococcus depolymerans]|uniref:GAF domain-containing protein n=1 Tax=Deinococcus depolymerans TaxID=392408 RepID=A0ABN1BP83_9DEIO
MSTSAPDSETLLLAVTRKLLAQSSENELCREGLTFLSELLGADLGLLHLRVSEHEYTLGASWGEHPLLDVHRVQVMEPEWVTLLTAGTWISAAVPSPEWRGPPERNYARLGAQHLVNFGLFNGPDLVGTVNLLFNRPRPDLNGLGVLGTIGALWGTLLSRMKAEEGVRAREAMLRTVTDQGTDLVTVLNRQGFVLYQSGGARLLLGRSAKDVTGRAALNVVHPDDLERVQEAFAALGRVPDSTVNLTFRALHRDGRVLWLEARGRNLLHEPAVRGVVVHSRDVTAQQRDRRFLERRVQELTLMHETSLQLQRAQTVQEVACRVVQLIEERLGHPFVRVASLDADGSLVTLARETGGPSEPVATGFAGECLRLGRSVLVGDVRLDPLYERPGGAHGDRVRSELVTPLRVAGQPWGVLAVESPEVDAFDDGDRQALETVAGQVGAALANVLLLADLRGSRDELRRAYDQTIEGWARALDFRDRETEGHSQRVTELAVSLARRMGLRGEQLVHLRRGALLHDIGKMGIPDAILLKPGPLDEEEWAVMRRHPEMALSLLEPIEFLRDALDIPSAHHEKWNGRGYPAGLAGEEIPLAARIFAVIDVWDALRHDRPYRPAWDAARARALLEAESGEHFDPAVVRAFLAWLDEADGQVLDGGKGHVS